MGLSCKLPTSKQKTRNTILPNNSSIHIIPANSNSSLHSKTTTAIPSPLSGRQTLTPPKMRDSISILLLVVLSCCASGRAAPADGFCSAAPGDEGSKPMYWKVTNPTLSPEHLQDLPGFTRSVYKRDHALVTPESHVFSLLPNWFNTLGAYLITPAMGSQFTMYLAKMQDNSQSEPLLQDVERFLFVVAGTAIVSNSSGIMHKLQVDSYAYIPFRSEYHLDCEETATLIVFERRYEHLERHSTELIIGSTEAQPLLETPGEVFELRKLLPTSDSYDFNIHIMDFKPGEYLNVKEVHYNQHGLLLLEGQGIYRLGESWYPVQAGDVIWMAPFVPQWYAALGKTRSRYLLYKDVNRNPL